MAKARFTAVSLMKDEGPYLVEWVAWHRMIGFDRIVIYTNDCSDGSEALLAEMEEFGVIHRNNPVPAGKKPQPHGLRLAEADPAVLDSDWIMVLDGDEFIDLRDGADLAGLVAACPARTQAICLTWRIMGSSGIRDWNPGLVTQTYLQGARDGFARGWGVKTLFRPFEDMRLGIHRPDLRGAKSDPARAERLAAQLWVNGSGIPLTRRFKRGAWRSSPWTMGRDLAEIKHYATRSFDNYLLRAARGNVNNKSTKYDTAYFTLFDRNETRQDGMGARGDDLRAGMDRMRANPALAKAERACLAHHAARMAAIAASPDYDARLEALGRAHHWPYGRLDEIFFPYTLPPEARAMVAAWQEAGHSPTEIAKAIAHSPRIHALEAAIDAEDAAEYAAMGLAITPCPRDPIGTG